MGKPVIQIKDCRGVDFEYTYHLSGENVCPECGEPMVQTCRCMVAHSSCKNGHRWHLATRNRKALVNNCRVVVEHWDFWELD